MVCKELDDFGKAEYLFFALGSDSKVVLASRA